MCDHIGIFLSKLITLFSVLLLINTIFIAFSPSKLLPRASVAHESSSATLTDCAFYHLRTFREKICPWRTKMLKILEIGKTLVVVKSKLLTLLKIMGKQWDLEKCFMWEMCLVVNSYIYPVKFFAQILFPHPCCSWPAFLVAAQQQHFSKTFMLKS